jgi:rhodanese-related sulfurtransferase
VLVWPPGELTPVEVYALLERDPQAVLVDVRTRAEWSYVGLPDLSGLGRGVVVVEWQSFPDGTVNRGFFDDLAAAGVRPDVPVAFICRSGVRSRSAAEAATAAGFGAASSPTGSRARSARGTPWELPLEGGRPRRQDPCRDGWRPDTLAVRRADRSDFDGLPRPCTSRRVRLTRRRRPSPFAGDIDRFIYLGTATRRLRSSNGCA